MIKFEYVNDKGKKLAETIERELQGVEANAIIFIGALGILTRKLMEAPHPPKGELPPGSMDISKPMDSQAPALPLRGLGGFTSKYTDPAVICVDSTGKYVIPVLSGHVGGANDLARQIAMITGGEAVITTQSDNTGLWALDTIAKQYGWGQSKLKRLQMNKVIANFVNQKPTALVIECEDEGTKMMEETCPQHVKIFRSFSDYKFFSRRNTDVKYETLIIVSPNTYPTQEVPTIQYFPPCLHLGVGCQKLAPVEIAPQLIDEIKLAGYAPESIATIGSIELKKDEPLLAELCKLLPQATLNIYTADELSKIKIPNPSDKVFEVTGCYGVAESSAKAPNTKGMLVIEKQKGKYIAPQPPKGASIQMDDNDNASRNQAPARPLGGTGGQISHYTYALAQDKEIERKGHIEIVGAGPGDPDLVSVRGRKFLETADLILYAGSLVPRELTFCAKHGATVRSSANMDLEEQFELMKEFYDKGKLVVRLHTGDPCIYGAIQEQMAFFDEYGMDYHITPGISSFLAAAAELRSQFTIPEKCQSIILTRGEGRTPMPEREKLHMLASHQSTMCIFLSASLAEQVQTELLEGGYPPETSIACCYKLTWKDQKIYRGQLKDLTSIMKKNRLTLTTMIVVGDAIDNREGLSKLYDGHFTHMFRKGK